MKPPARRSSLRADALNLPNLLTMARVAMIPVILVLLQQQTPSSGLWASLVYVLAAVTDALDGWLARVRNLVSVLGKFLDPLADKLLVVSVLVLLNSMHRVPYWVVVLILARELSITALRTIAMSEGVVISASQTGKEKTALQMLAIVMLMLYEPVQVNVGGTVLSVSLHAVGLALLYLSLFFAITSAGEYIHLFVQAVEAKEKRLSQASSHTE